MSRRPARGKWLVLLFVLLTTTVTAAVAQLTPDSLSISRPTLLRQAEILLNSGQRADALRSATMALARAREDGKPRAIAQAAATLAELSRLSGALASASEQLYMAEEHARAFSDPSFDALLKLLRANLLVSMQQPEQALRTYRLARDQAQAADEPLLMSWAILGQSAQSQTTAELSEADQAKETLLRAVGRVPKASDQANVLIVAAHVYAARQLQRESLPLHDEVFAQHALQQALSIAERIDHNGLRSRALGALGRLHEVRREHKLALHLSRSAAFHAQNLPELQYQWQWQIGRVLDAGGELDGAIQALRLATNTLQTLRTQPTEAAARADMVALNYAFADLLLRRATALPTSASAERVPLLFEARQSVESLKAAELRDYFRDDCVTELQSRITPIDRLPAGSAAIYPVLLTDRLELLLSLPDDLRQVTVKIDRLQFIDTVRRFRKALEKRTTREYLPLAQQLYDWLIRPLEPLLQQASITTLIIVPEGSMRTIPLSALHDGVGFLVQRYAMATTPGLLLTDAGPLKRSGLRAMLAGISKPVQGFSALNRVPAELSQIRSLLGGSLLQDESFVVAELDRQLEREPFSVVHIASHAQFETDPAKTFLLAFDNKLGLEKLSEMVGISQYRKEPIELLTLSACQSAAGDDNAALGLAGVAIRAGARSALAGLWFIDDEVASTLVVEFYRRLLEPNTSKARALQEAQNTMIADRRYAHPGYWAPFLMIGNWQ